MFLTVLVLTSIFVSFPSKRTSGKMVSSEDNIWVEKRPAELDCNGNSFPKLCGGVYELGTSICIQSILSNKYGCSWLVTAR